MTLALTTRVSQARMEMIFRLRERNRLRVDYFKLSRFGDQNVTRQIVFGNNSSTSTIACSPCSSGARSGSPTRARSGSRSGSSSRAGIGFALLEARAKGVVAARNIREERSQPPAYFRRSRSIAPGASRSAGR